MERCSPTKRNLRALLAVAAVGAAALTACGEGGEAASREAVDGKPQVVASTALIAEFASRVAGGDASVKALVPPGVDIHSYEPSPAAARRIAEAQLVLVNGYRLEEALLDVIVANRSAGVPLVAVSRGIRLPERDGEDEREHDEPEGLVFADGDPHLWLDVANAIRYVETIRDALIDIDPPHAGRYRERAAEYVAELRDLDVWIRDTLSVVVPERRKIVVFHDAFQYFSRSYGFELTAAVLPASPTQQVSAAALVDVIEIVERERLPAVYREPQFSGQVLDVVARETGARVLTLYATFGAGVDEYAELMRANARALVDGLGP